MDLKYKETHPWLVFEPMSERYDFELWLLLGAAESKCRHLAGIPLRPEKQDEINRITFIRGVQATTAIEGNRLTAREIGEIIDGMASGIHTDMPRSREYQRREVENAVSAYNAIARHVEETGAVAAGLSELLSDNAVLLNGLKLEDGVSPGRFRSHSVVVGSYRGAPAGECEYLVSRLFAWLGDDWGLPEHKMVVGILKALMAHLYIAWIHPFGDGNGRSARLTEFRYLMKAGIPFNAAHLLTTHYNETRSEYYLALSEASRSRSPLEFLRYALRGFADALDAQIATILEEQVDITWQNYVHSRFSGEKSEAQLRRRALLLELSEREATKTDAIRASIGRSLSKQYEGKTLRTLNRDIGALEAMGLLIKGDGFVMPCKQKMKAFMPLIAG